MERPNQEGTVRVNRRRARGSILPLRPEPFLLLFSLILLTMAPLVQGQSLDRLVVRNDARPLQPDLETGRFGTGKLYFDDPVDVAVDGEGDVYILDGGNFRIQVMNERGRFLRKWGGKGMGDGRFNDPVALAISPDDDFLVVLDRDPARVQVFSPDGSFLLSFAGKRIGKGSMDEPADLTIDSQNYIYVVDRGRDRILKFHRSGAFVDEWGSTGRREKDLADPVSVAFSEKLTGFIYVLDAGKGALFVYHRDGDYRETIFLGPELLSPVSDLVRVETDREEGLFILDASLGKLIKFEERSVGLFSLRSETVSLEKPAGLSFDPERGIYVSDLSRNRLFRFPFELD